ILEAKVQIIVSVCFLAFGADLHRCLRLKSLGLSLRKNLKHYTHRTPKARLYTPFSQELGRIAHKTLCVPETRSRSDGKPFLPVAAANCAASSQSRRRAEPLYLRCTRTCRRTSNQ